MKTFLALAALVAISCSGPKNEEVQSADLTHGNTAPPAPPAPGAPPATPSTTPNSSTTSTAPTTDFRHQFVVAAKAISPAVVAITSTSVARRRESGSPLDFFF